MPTPLPPVPAAPPQVPLPGGERFALRPTSRTLAMRTSLPVQLWRFVVINFRMLRMIFLSHR